MKYQMIAKQRKVFPVKTLCKVFDVPPTSFYDSQKRPEGPRAKSEKVILEEIKVVHKECKQRYGSPRIYEELKVRGIDCSENRVARIMSDNEIKAVFKKQFRITTDSKHNNMISPNLLERDFSAEAPNPTTLF